MLVRLLDPVDVVVAGVVRPINGLRRKAVLAVLGLTAGEMVGTDRLLDVVWDGRPPAVGLNALQTHVSYLRRVLGSPVAIVARGPGYVLDPGAEATDVQAAARLVEQGRQESRRPAGGRVAGCAGAVAGPAVERRDGPDLVGRPGGAADRYAS